MKRLMLLSAVVSLVLLQTSCFNLNLNKNNPPATSLSAQLVDEWAASVGASTGRAISSSGPSRAILSSDRIASLKAAATSAIAAAGKANSTKMDEIIPAMLNGISSGMSTGSYTATEMASVLDATTTAVVGSVTKTGREASLTTGLTVSDVVGLSTTKIVAVIIDKVAVANPELTVTTIGFIVDASISSLSSSATITTTADKEKAIACIVSGVSDSVFGSVATTSSGLTDYAQAAMSAIGSSASAAIVDVLPPAEATTAVAKVVEAAVSSASTSGVLETAVLQTLVAAVSQSSSAAAPSAAQITAAISTGAGSTTAPVIDVSSIVSEAEPSVTGSVSKSTITESSTVDLTATATDVTYAWTQLTGPIEANITGAASATAKVALNIPGSYSFRITVQNSGGFKQAHADVTIVANFLTTDLTAGIRALAVKDFDGARSSFLSAYAQDSSNVTAAMWSSLLDLAAIAVNSDVVDLMKNRIGIVDYPATMNALFSSSWFNQAWYNPGNGFMANSSGSYIRGTFIDNPSGSFNGQVYRMSIHDSGVYGYISKSSFTATGDFIPSDSGTDYVEASVYQTVTGSSASSLTHYTSATIFSKCLLPTVTMPDWIADYLESQNTDRLNSVKNYPYALIGSIIERNPSGFNQAIDKVLAGVYGNAFDAAYAKIMSLADDASITVPRSILTAFGPVDSSIQGINIDGRELKLYAAQMRLQKALVEYLGSYSFTYPISSAAQLLVAASTASMNTNGASGGFDFTQIDNPFEAGFLVDRGQGKRDSSQADFEAALTDLSTVVAGFDATVCEKYVSFMSRVNPKMPPAGDDIAAYFSMAGLYIDAVNASIAGTSTFDPTGSGGMALDLSVLFTRSFLSLDHLLETHGPYGVQDSGFTLYGTTDAYTTEKPTHAPGTGVALFTQGTHSFAGFRILPGDIDALLGGTGKTAELLAGPTSKAKCVVGTDGNLYMMSYAGSGGDLQNPPSAPYTPPTLNSFKTMLSQ